MFKFIARFFVLCLILAFGFAPTNAQGDTSRVIPVRSLLFDLELSPDGKTVAISENGIVHNDEVVPSFLPIQLIDIASGETRLMLSGHSDYATSLAFSPDSTELATLHRNGDLLIWDVTTGKMLNRLAAIAGGGRIRFMPDGQHLLYAIGGQIPQFVIFDIETGYITRLMTPRYPTYAQFRAQLDTPLAFTLLNFDLSADGQWITFISPIGYIYMWNTEANFPRLLYTPLENEAVRDIYFLNGTSQIAYANRDGIQIVETLGGGNINTISADSLQFKISPDQEKLAWFETGSDVIPTLHIVSIDGDMQESHVLDLPRGMSGRGQVKLAFTPDGHQIVIGGFAALETGENALLVINLH